VVICDALAKTATDFVDLFLGVGSDDVAVCGLHDLAWTGGNPGSLIEEGERGFTRKRRLLTKLSAVCAEFMAKDGMMNDAVQTPALATAGIGTTGAGV